MSLARQHAPTFEAEFRPPPDGPEPSWIIGCTFSDDVWLAKGQNETRVVINFGLISPAHRFTCKTLLWALEYEADTRANNRRLFSVASFQAYYYRFRRLTQFLEREKKTLLFELSEDDIKRFVRDVVANKATFSINFALQFGALFARLYALGPAGNGKLPDGMRIKLTWKDIDRFLSERTKTRSTPIMADITARTIVNAAIEFLDFAEEICVLQQMSQMFCSSPKYAERRSRKSSVRSRTKFLTESSMREDFEVASDRVMQRFKVIPQALSDDRYAEVSGVRHSALLMARGAGLLAQHMTAACFICCAALTGFRGGEILSIREGDVEGSGVSCRVTTQVYKGSTRSRGVPISRPGHPIVERVVSILKMLAVAKGTNDLWYLSQGRLTNDNLSSVLQQFAAEIAGVDTWRLTSRQFRRYYSIFAIMRFQIPEDALRRALHHVSDHAIQSYIKDEDGARYMLEDKRNLVEDIYLALASDSPAYKATGSTSIQRTMMKYAASNLPIEEIEREVKRHLAKMPLEIWPTVWGYCMLSKDDHIGAVCGSKVGKPIAMEMYPSNCGRCQHLIVGRDQLGFWQNTRELHVEIVENVHSPPNVKRKSSRMVQIADLIIARMQPEGL